MGNKKTEAKKRNIKNRRAREARKVLNPDRIGETYVRKSDPIQSDHEYGWDCQGFAEFLDCGDK